MSAMQHPSSFPWQFALSRVPLRTASLQGAPSSTCQIFRRPAYTAAEPSTQSAGTAPLERPGKDNEGTANETLSGNNNKMEGARRKP
jgi:hypothetical protein